MNVSKSVITILQIAVLLLTFSCSNSEEPEERNVIKKTTDKIAHDAVGAMKKPINSAGKVQLLSNDRNQEIKEAAKQE
jgi:hypothetical protein